MDRWQSGYLQSMDATYHSLNFLIIMQPDLLKVLWPVFVYSFLNLVSDYYPKESRKFFSAFKEIFEGGYHQDDLRKLEPISLPEHVLDSEIAKIYRGSKYRVKLSQMAFCNLIMFLESKETDGGSVIVSVIQTNLNIVTVEQTLDDQLSLARLLNRANGEDYPAEDEGIPGHNPGSANIDRNSSSTVLTKLKLGPLPAESELSADVRADLEEEDIKNPPKEGQISFSQVYEQQQIKQEESEESPSRNDIPLPPSVARDVAMEVQRLRENRNRFKIEGRTGGVSASVSVTMFTLHNTFDWYKNHSLIVVKIANFR